MQGAVLALVVRQWNRLHVSVMETLMMMMTTMEFKLSQEGAVDPERLDMLRQMVKTALPLPIYIHIYIYIYINR